MKLISKKAQTKKVHASAKQTSNRKNMKISQEISDDIQIFVYFLFRGSLTPKLIQEDYVERLIANPDLLYGCFEVFAKNYFLGKNYQKSVSEVESFISKNEIYSNDKNSIEIVSLTKNSFWFHFLQIAEIFCKGSFPVEVTSFNLEEFNGNGTSAVPFFSIWLNNVELDSKGNMLNFDYSLKRANERLKRWDDVEPERPFEDWELEQAIY